jgi:MFS family permease
MADSAISSWIPPYIGSVAAKAGLPAPQWASFTSMAYNIGSIISYVGFGFLADVHGRKPVSSCFLQWLRCLRLLCFF